MASRRRLLATNATLATLAALAVAGCSAARPAPMAECDTDKLAFFGENVTLAGLGFDPSMVGNDANRRATVWVTAEPVAIPGEMPPGARPPPPQRWLCAEFDDGSGIGMNIDDSWEPPIPGATADAPGSGPPVGTIAVGVAAIVVVAVSYVAFRRGER